MDYLLRKIKQIIEKQDELQNEIDYLKKELKREYRVNEEEFQNLISSDTDSLENIKEENQIFCPVCGLNIDSNAWVCIHCGYKLESSTHVPNELVTEVPISNDEQLESNNPSYSFEIKEEYIIEKQPIDEISESKEDTILEMQPRDDLNEVDQGNTETKDKFAEFFIGKNIINKLGSVLVALGFIALIQYAYGWLTPSQKVMLIGLFGLSFLVAGIILNIKEKVLFGNGFFTTGLLTLYGTIYYASSVHNLLPDDYMRIMLLIVGVMSFGLLKIVRNDYINNFIYYASYIPIYSILPLISSGKSELWFITLLAPLLVIIINMLYQRYLWKDKADFSGISIIKIIIFLIVFGSRSFYHLDLYLDHLDLYLDSKLVIILLTYTLPVLFYFGILNYKLGLKVDFKNISILSYSIIAGYLSLNALPFKNYDGKYIDFTDTSITMILVTILFSITFTLLYLKNKRNNLISPYIYMTTLGILIFGIVSSLESSLDIYSVFLVYGVFALGYYLLKWFTNNWHFMINFAFLLVANITTFTVGYSISVYKNDIVKYYLYYTLISALIFTFHKIYKKIKEEDIDIVNNIKVTCLLTFYIPLLPVVSTLVHRAFKDGFVNVNIINLIILTIFTILYRYLLNLKVLKVNFLYIQDIITAFAVVFLIISNLTKLVLTQNTGLDWVTWITLLLINIFVIYVLLLFKEKNYKENIELEELKLITVFALYLTLIINIYRFFEEIISSLDSLPLNLNSTILSLLVIIGFTQIFRYLLKMKQLNSTHINHVRKVFDYSVTLIIIITNFIAITITTNTSFNILVFVLMLSVNYYITYHLLLSKKNSLGQIELLERIKAVLPIIMYLSFSISIYEFFRQVFEPHYNNFMVISFLIVIIFSLVYRYLLELKHLKAKYMYFIKKAFDLISIIFVFIINLQNFIFDSLSLMDYLSWMILFLLNAYVGYKIFEYIKEAYTKYPKVNKEKIFIFFYSALVIIHGYFIHFYINFQYDKIVLTSYFIIMGSVAVLYGFEKGMVIVRRSGLGFIFYSLAKFFIYDLFVLDTILRIVSYFLFGLLLLGVSFIYSYLEKKYIT